MSGILGISKIRETIIDLVFQDTSLMDRIFLGHQLYARSELLIRFVIFCLGFAALYLLTRPSSLLTVFVLLVIVWVLNWIFNGHGYQLIFEFLRLQYSSSTAIRYVTSVADETRTKHCAALIYGGFSRGTANMYSDIDIFVLSNGSWSMGIRLAFLCLRFRLTAIISRLSVDIYTIDKSQYLRDRARFKTLESPVVLNDPSGFLHRLYPNETSIDSFFESLRSVYTRQ
jgi:predicted nucleotidyltransferase